LKLKKYYPFSIGIEYGFLIDFLIVISLL